MNWLALIFAMQIGMVNNGFDTQNIVGNESHWVSPENAFEITIEPTFILFEHFKIKSFMRSYQIPCNTGFFPYQMDYGIDISVNIGPFSIGGGHECDHTMNLIGQPKPFMGGISNSSSEVYIRFEHKFTF